MSVSGLCQICEQKEIADGCDMCGRVVCRDHYDHSSGYCTACLADIGRRPKDTESKQNRDRPADVDDYQY